MYELRAVVGGSDRVVRHGVDPRSHAYENSADSGPGRPIDLVQGVENDEPSANLGRFAQLVVALVVPVHDDALAGDAGGPRECQLPERRHVGAEARLGEEAKQCQARKRLHAVNHEPAAGRPAVVPRRGEEGLLAVDEEGRAETLGER